MNLLAVDTSSDIAALALCTGAGRRLVPETRAEPARRHGRDLLPSIRALLQDGGIAPRDLDVVAVGLGPGSYTGLRIGLTAARMIAYAAGAAILGLDSLEAWARSAPAQAGRIHVIADAQRGDVYAAAWERDVADAPLRKVMDSRLEPLAAWSARLVEGDHVRGPAVASPAIRRVIPPAAIVADAVPDDGRGRSEAILEMALKAWGAGRRDDLWALEPRYLRRSAAEDQRDARGAASMAAR
ncbi:tRNA threonylcarbamoyladenosine biosynthesis protein TsaB [Aquisphaera giovannonii]|uniref:tRNA threonylcarbamoyladenosine biosynthesis protein TsaB n=1 Tax=Aquisphaera giovannonii TaxID=406548 RepID=A0A5B9W1Q6_9BACT|nr:tRNA (adenosine(37)-N6)-threonylcarbamoyltransferase complex dimerization subunit type 1 TsaB [Aquisphaera giovannonii]QEH34164.1 tRNA threonylcarbamoyladenosine biosynthesis protein TsaB [Aquisphaera giovannonii]